MDTRAKIHGPVGTCKYCGQEFMRKGSLERHEKDICPQRPIEAKEPCPPQSEPPVENKKPRLYKARAVIGGAVIWAKD